MSVGPNRRQILAGAVAAATVCATGKAVLASSSGVTHEVEIRKFKFSPKELTVKVGDTIRWINRDLAPHTATAESRGWDTGRIRKGEAVEIVVVAGMETTYFCALHPQMKASIVIDQ